MNTVHYKNLPKVDDIISFELETHGNNGVLSDPVTINQITIYHIEKNSYSSNDWVIKNKYYNPDLEKEYENLQSKGGLSEQEVKSLNKLKIKMEETAKFNPFYYTNAKIVVSFKDVWNKDSKTNKVRPIFNDKKSIPGKFLFCWKAIDVREGDYLIRWSWKNEDGKLKTAEKIFVLAAAEQKVNSIYSKFVPREKYNFLMDKYVPPMYRIKTTPDDMTPEVCVKFNKSIAQALLELDDLAVGLIDLLDPTFINEGLLPVIANFFKLELKSHNVGAWRNQIRNAVPLYKQKGTLEGLTRALDKSGIRLLKLTNLWQVISPYTWTDGFIIEKDIGTNSEIIGSLSKRPIDAELEVAIKSVETDEYFILSNNIVSLQEVGVPEPRTVIIWNGISHDPPIELFKGDIVKVSYNYNKIPEDAKSLESYIKNLPLSDQRDERKVKYPLKNWNVKLIEEDDPLFNLLVPKRHPAVNPVVYGKIRTTFLYSEKAFNMDTYNGSLYNSNNPCDMDKDFVDSCSGGQSSKFDVHLECDNITNDKVQEAKEIIIDYSPFHAILHNMKINSKITDFISSPLETIKQEVKTNKKGEEVRSSEAIYCQIKYKDGRNENGRIA